MNTIAADALTVMPIERKDGTHVLRLCLTQGEMSLPMVKRVLEVMEKYELTALRATTGQRMNLEGIPSERLDEVIEALGVAVQKCPPGVSVCPGGGVCRFGVQKTRDLGNRLLEIVKKNAPYPYKVKSGISGCKMACGLSFVRDIGLVAGPKGWDVYFGGAATRNPGRGVLIGKAMSEDEALAAVEKGLLFYKENARKRERIGAMVQRMGHDVIAEALA